MAQITGLLLKFLRAIFLLMSIAGLLFVAPFVAYHILYPSTPGDVVVLNVRQRISHYNSELHSQAEQQVAGGKPARLLMHAQIGTLVVQEPSAVRRVLLRLVNAERGPLPMIVAGLAFALLMAKILGDIKPGVPFTAANVRRLRWLAVLLLCCEVYQRAASWWMQDYLSRLPAAGTADLVTNADFGSSMLSSGLAAAVLVLLASSYQRGVELTEEAELTV
ncbi:DUF2975 domain-containing protein [Hymenobacter yonginensis]|uniref:DUF2975 domain-containing protein n=1 Tax=Hymenobacter yonginensis TaxID=748197 RepID=A0ABY7PRG0_9BACT|nr:DUF2975 domain-containing protein [Hymenobacter yonginensis]WBO85438.1 DUF2975 domain-containing protein [Hymenobacter yonginensis]